MNELDLLNMLTVVGKVISLLFSDTTFFGRKLYGKACGNNSSSSSGFSFHCLSSSSTPPCNQELYLYFKSKFNLNF
jgi:hypothetical protein